MLFLILINFIKVGKFISIFYFKFDFLNCQVNTFADDCKWKEVNKLNKNVLCDRLFKIETIFTRHTFGPHKLPPAVLELYN